MILEGLDEFVERTVKIGVDALIVADPGVYQVVRSVSPDIDVHLSTQANVTNWRSALYWYRQGVRRIILARELTLDEIVTIREKVPDDLELEVFIHGAMCVSYSGKVPLSSYMAGRDSNRVYAFIHAAGSITSWRKPGPAILPVYENDSGTYIFNSKDLCMIQHLRS